MSFNHSPIHSFKSMLIVLSSPVSIANEAQYINSLFNTGLEVFHLRKPESKAVEVEYLLKNIEEKYHPQIAIHQHHHLATHFAISRLHYTELLRNDTNDKTLNQYVENGFILSTSIHDLKTYKAIGNQFSYSFIGPLFNSISKKGYHANADLAFQKNKEIIGKAKLIAIGGIDETNIATIKGLNYTGAAILGAIWNKPPHGVSTFKKIQALWI
ncbi:thiamine phosphate synthase [Pedobacter nototheniae]|uniref:thiamine phosphate synthase n=1 Tax=Pedobacter nototheniae TaxID=2488994 RepID=UPI0013F3F616|nr:thiamine phosphate synthase [Pedobacter nototheniae]